MAYISVAIIFFIASLFLIGGVLRKDKPDHVVAAFFLFFLVLVLVPIITEIAISVGAIEKDTGTASNYFGRVLMVILKESYDLRREFIFYSIIFIVILLPQVLTFIFCSFFGCAHKLRLVSKTYSLVVWGMVKSLIIFGAVLISFTGWTYLMHSDWKIFDNMDPSLKNFSESLVIGVLSFFCSVFILSMKYIFEEAVVKFPWVGRCWNFVLSWATRCRKPDSSLE